jgi:hypothetical protein
MGQQSTDQDTAVDAAGLIQFFGGRSSLHAKLNAHGHPITLKGLDKWKERGSIRPGWLAVLADIAKSENRTLDLTRFLARHSQEAPSNYETEEDDGVLD